MIIGHQKEWEFLKKSAEKRSLSHAYLFYGPQSVGKRKVAMEFAKYLNCKDHIKNNPCQKCIVCYQIEGKFYPDLSLVEKKLDEQAIGIEQIKDLKAKLSLSCALEGHKTAIIDQAHLMTHDAQNALLKQLEEPKGKTIIILIAEHPHRLLGTVLSRCQKIRFSPVPSYLIKEYFPKNEALKENHLYALGRPGIVFGALANPQTDAKRKKLEQDMIQLKQASFHERFSYAKKIIKNGGEISEIFGIWILYLRNLMQNYLEKKKNNIWNLKELRKIISLAQEMQHLIDTSNVNKQLALELFLMEI